MNLSIPDHIISRDSDVFESDHVPTEFNYRDAQMKDLAFSLSRGLYVACPINARARPATVTKVTQIKTVQVFCMYRSDME